MTIPTVGRSVHFFDRARASWGLNGIGPYAAVITKVHDEHTVDVHVFPMRMQPHTYEAMTAVPFGQTKEGRAELGSWWEWPAKV